MLLGEAILPGSRQTLERIFDNLLEGVGRGSRPVACRARGGTGEHAGATKRLPQRWQVSSGRSIKGKAPADRRQRTCSVCRPADLKRRRPTHVRGNVEPLLLAQPYRQSPSTGQPALGMHCLPSAGGGPARKR